MLKRILIANRGEIACRIARTCRRLGIEYVAVYSEADSKAMHLCGAAQTVFLGAGVASDSYLDSGKLLRAALETNCQAVHPGYGFLSENSEFAAAVESAGLIFIGPTPEIIAALGDKASAKVLMRKAGVPVVPGSDEASDDPKHIEEQVRRIALPALLKPSAGGGGKGMQIIHTHDDLTPVIESAIRVARSSFGDGRMIVERYIEQPRHIEVQVFGDGRGNVVHLFERECSLQRRHQKVIEEAPAPHLPEQVRQRLLGAAVQGASSLGYRNAGTFEFIVGSDFQFYFLEVNTRLQVEHPVTEAITGQDLVEWQLRVASGQALPLAQSDIVCRGHAIEARIYAEDPAHDFRPSPGSVIRADWPSGLRVDAGLEKTGEVPPFYDPMIAKIIASADDRPAALIALQVGLRDTTLLGVTSNIGYLLRLLDAPEVQTGKVHTRYLDERRTLQMPHSREAAVAVGAALSLSPSARQASPWAPGSPLGVFDRHALDPAAPLGYAHFILNKEQVAAGVLEMTPEETAVNHGSQTWRVEREDSGLRGRVEQRRWEACPGKTEVYLQIEGDHYTLSSIAHGQTADSQKGSRATAPMSGLVATLTVRPGDRVRSGDVLAVIEAMKMEHSITAEGDGLVQALLYKQGESVREGDLVVDIFYDNTVQDL